MKRQFVQEKQTNKKDMITYVIVLIGVAVVLFTLFNQGHHEEAHEEPVVIPTN